MTSGPVHAEFRYFNKPGIWIPGRIVHAGQRGRLGIVGRHYVLPAQPNGLLSVPDSVYTLCGELAGENSIEGLSIVSWDFPHGTSAVTSHSWLPSFLCM